MTDWEVHDLKFQPQPCVGCGYCCRTAPCTHAHRALGRIRGTCPFLIERDGRWWCNLVLEGKVEPVDLWIGEGCCSPLNSDRLPYLRGRVPGVRQRDPERADSRPEGGTRAPLEPDTVTERVEGGLSDEPPLPQMGQTEKEGKDE